MRRRLAAIAAITVSVLFSAGMLAGCGPEDLDSSGTTTGESAAPVDPACGGSADQDLESALKVITGPNGCPGATNTFWSQQLGGVWTEPRIISYRDGEIPDSACGTESDDPNDFASNAFYCTLDDTVAYSEDFMASLYEQGGATYPMFVLMHELGHRASTLSGQEGVVSRSEENQADCLAGAQAKFTHDAGRLPGGDIISGFGLFIQLGDQGGQWFSLGEPNVDPDAHGNPSQRAAAFGTGYLRDVDKCFEIGQSADGGISLLDTILG
ncbi:neutral zinc metallopeptidase [Frankia sp. CNm7]|uniref:Neutral zinc metallopeptidase n=1 Tax=Frankia nepalensis TaxID=1836974 RepID=A0A937RCX1_9ACTN|nr:neutral zinc metallopeptidase [Frankia nepalensis]MBL7497223.1 neutral zinc metallopeptidase [Frankia nepalensis]MBL7519228.1 neutral zinc metallopeptidase [Frankia nepalensis]MBL7626680.1 neutral zinc metallopeptidase [Frankia nepalensis]